MSLSTLSFSFLYIACFTSWWGILLALIAGLLGFLLARLLFCRRAQISAASRKQTVMNRKFAGLLDRRRGLGADTSWNFGNAQALAKSTTGTTEGVGLGAAGTAAAAAAATGLAGAAGLAASTATDSKEKKANEPYDWSKAGVSPRTAKPITSTASTSTSSVDTEKAKFEKEFETASTPDVPEVEAPAFDVDVDVPEIEKDYALEADLAIAELETIEDMPLDTTARPAAEYQSLAKAEFDGEDVKIDPNLGIVYNYSAKPEIDDLTLIKGIGPVLENKLNERGVYRFKQLANWDEHNINAFALELDTFPDRVTRDRWVPQARELADLAKAEGKESFLAPLSVDYAAKIASDFEGEDVSADDELGIVYNQKPELADDLKAINGVGPVLEEKLNKFGVYRYKQLANWSDRNVEVFSERLETFKDRIERDKWIPQAKRLHAQRFRISGWDSRDPTEIEYEELVKMAYRDEDVRIDKPLGVVYPTPPAVKDDLTALPGCTPYMAGQLNALGIYRAKQISHWSEEAVSKIVGKFGLPRDYIYAWVDTASLGLPDEPHRETVLDDEAPTDTLAPSKIQRPTPVSAPEPEPNPAAPEIPAEFKETANKFEGESVKIDPKLGILYNERPEWVDDLTYISGVGQVIHEKLNAHGVWRWKQIALWTDQQAADFSDELATFKDRIQRDDWIGQARALHQKFYNQDP